MDRDLIATIVARVNGGSDKRAAEILGVTPNAVKQRLYVARRMTSTKTTTQLVVRLYPYIKDHIVLEHRPRLPWQDGGDPRMTARFQ